jgi:hypothetical protein
MIEVAPYRPELLTRVSRTLSDCRGPVEFMVDIDRAAQALYEADIGLIDLSRRSFLVDTTVIGAGVGLWRLWGVLP